MTPEPSRSSILVVDDAPANLDFLAGLLTERGYEVRPVQSGRLALLAAQSDPPDLILLDINMSDMDGYEVCKRLKSAPSLKDIPVIFISAYTETLDKVKAFSIGGVDYVTKPFHIEEVQARIETHLGLRRLWAELEESQEKYRTLVENANSIIYKHDASGNILFMNEYAQAYFGYTAQEIAGKNVIGTILSEEDSSGRSVYHITNEVEVSPEKCQYHEKECLRKNGQKTWVAWTNKALFDENMHLREVLCIGTDITERKKAEEALQHYREHLEELVAERTANLRAVNEQLRTEIAERKRVMAELKQSQEALESKTATLEEVNTALKVLLRQLEGDRTALEERFVSNVQGLVLPYVEKLRRGRLDQRQLSWLAIIETNLGQIVSPFLHSIRQLNLTPREIEIASLVKEGRRTKEIAEIIGVAPSAIDFYRKNIRSKLNLNKKKVNLQSYLRSIG